MSKVIPLSRAILNAEEGAEIYAQRPFSAESKAMLIELDGDGFLPEGFRESAEHRCFEKFLDTDSVNEVLEAAYEVRIRRDQLIELVLHYAEYREYPPWFYDLESKN
jgi:hypothetical protein